MTILAAGVTAFVLVIFYGLLPNRKKQNNNVPLTKVNLLNSITKGENVERDMHRSPLGRLRGFDSDTCRRGVVRANRQNKVGFAFRDDNTGNRSDN